MGKIILFVLRLLRPILRRSRKLEFVTAVVVAWLADWKEKWDALREALRLEYEVGEELRLERIAVCRSCPIFDPLLQTCGSALADIGKIPDEKRGCHCHVPTAAAQLHNCWAYDQRDRIFKYGWKTDLNSFPYE